MTARRSSPSYEPNTSSRSRPSSSRDDYLAQRRAQRAASSVTIWPRSPSPDLSLLKSSSEDESDRETKRRKLSGKSGRKRRLSGEQGHRRTQEDDEWVEDVKKRTRPIAKVPSVKTIVKKNDTSDDDQDIGPRPAPVMSETKQHRHYGDRLPRGEAEAMAAFVAAGERIPQRGEIGLEADQIAAFEAAGYVMSGNRNKKMAAVRMRKENQVITVEEKRSLLKMQQEERLKREAAIVSSFRELIAEKLQTSKSN